MTPLHQFGQFMRQLLLAVPMWMVKLLMIATLTALFVWVLTLDKSETEPETGAKRWDENLKIIACITLLVQILLYSLL